MHASIIITDLQASILMKYLQLFQNIIMAHKNCNTIHNFSMYIINY